MEAAAREQAKVILQKIPISSASARNDDDNDGDDHDQLASSV